MKGRGFTNVQVQVVTMNWPNLILQSLDTCLSRAVGRDGRLRLPQVIPDTRSHLLWNQSRCRLLLMTAWSLVRCFWWECNTSFSESGASEVGYTVDISKRETDIQQDLCFCCGNVCHSQVNIWLFKVVLRNNRVMWACRGDCTDIFQHSVILSGHGLSCGWSGCHPCAGTHCVNGPSATYFDVPPVSSVCLSITPSHKYLLHFIQWTQSFLCLSANFSDVQREPCH